MSNSCYKGCTPLSCYIAELTSNLVQHQLSWRLCCGTYSLRMDNRQQKKFLVLRLCLTCILPLSGSLLFLLAIFIHSRVDRGYPINLATTVLVIASVLLPVLQVFGFLSVFLWAVNIFWVVIDTSFYIRWKANRSSMSY